MNDNINTLPEPIKPGEEKIVVNQISIRSADRSRKDIQDWKSAMITAESVYNPNRTRLYDLYSDILLDGHLSGVVNKRIDSVLNKNIYFEDAKGSKVDIVDDLLHSRRFRELLRSILEVPLYGISGIEFIPGKELDFKVIPRKHIKPKWGIISYEQNGQEGIPYLDNPNLWVIGEATDLGLLLKCAPYALMKRGNLADWAQFIEVFGMPMRVIKYEAHDRQAKVELQEVLDESGSALGLLIPKTAEFQLIDGKASNANGDLQDKFTRSLNDEMSIVVLGNTETTSNNNGGSNAKSLTQQKEQMEITKSDMRFLSGWLNDPQFVDILVSYGYPAKGGRFSFEKEIDISQVTQQVNVVKEVKGMGVPIDDDYIYDLTGIPKPDHYEAMKKEAAERMQQYHIAEPDKKLENNKQKETEDLSDSVWHKVRSKLADFFDPAL